MVNIKSSFQNKIPGSLHHGLVLYAEPPAVLCHDIPQEDAITSVVLVSREALVLWEALSTSFYVEKKSCDCSSSVGHSLGC
jgi:hypothetical protein